MEKILVIATIAMLAFGCSYKVERITIKTKPTVPPQTATEPSYLILSEDWKVLWGSEITFPTTRRCEFTIIPKPEWKGLDYHECGTTIPAGYLSTIHDGEKIIWRNPNEQKYNK